MPRVNVPALPTPLIGRQHELDKLRHLLTDPQCRLLTFVGPGGIGKTRLSIETATQCQQDFADGVYFVPLAPLTSARLVIPVLAESIGFVFHSDTSTDPRTQLLHFLKGKHALLVVDNLEHLLGDTFILEFLAELNVQTTQIKLLVTSRESLGLQGEWVFEVHGLPIPDNTDIEGTSVELFLQRARRADVGFNVTAEDIPAIARICRSVNGMPLGIELAAAWVRTLSCEEIAREIEHSLDFLSATAKDLPVRHRSMRAVFDHSWTLLSEEEQDSLIRLAVFQSGFSRESAQHIAKTSLPTLSALVTKSMIRRNGIGRYDLHELVRQYALDRLSDRPRVEKEVRSRHGRYFMDFLSRRGPPLRSSTQREALAQLLVEIDNIRAALEWALVHTKFELIERALGAYSTFLDTRGWMQEGLDYLGQVKSGLESKSSLSKRGQAALAHVLTSRSLFAMRMGMQAEARDMLNCSLEILRGVNEPAILVEALTFLGIVTVITGDLARSEELFREGLQVAIDSRDPWYEALCLTELAGINLMRRETETLHEQFQAAVQAWRKTGDLRFTAFGLTSLGTGAMIIGMYADAQAAMEESIEINRSIGDRTGLANSYRGLGLVSQARGEHEPALVSFRQSMQYFGELGGRWEAARLLSEMARSCLALGDESEAQECWHKSLGLAMESNGLVTVMDVIVDIAEWTRRKDRVYALRLLLLSIQHPATLREARDRAEDLVAELKEHTAPGDLKAAHQFAEQASLEDIVTELKERMKG